MSETRDESQNLKKSDGLGTIDVEEIEKIVGVFNGQYKNKRSFSGREDDAGRTSLSSLSSKEFYEKDQAMLSDKPFNNDLNLPLTDSVMQEFTVTKVPIMSSLANKKSASVNQDVEISDVVQTNFA